MKSLLIVAHTPSPNTRLLLQHLHAAAAQAADQVEVRVAGPFAVDAECLQAADALILLTPENFGYMSGALKDFFDRLYYRVIDSKRGLPYALVVRAGKDGSGCVRAIEAIVRGLGWRAVQAPLILRGEFQEARFCEEISQLGTTVCMALEEGMI